MIKLVQRALACRFNRALLFCDAGAILTPLLANMSANSVLLQNIIDQNNLMGLAIDHAIEQPDTVVDDCEVCIPLARLCS